MPERCVTPLSIVIFVLGLQALVVICPMGATIWPFTDYPMYSDVHFAGEMVHRRRLVGVREDGETVLLIARDFGLTQWAFQAGPLAAVLRGDTVRARAFADNLIPPRGRLTAFRIIDRARILTSSGTEERLIVTELQLNNDDQ